MRKRQSVQVSERIRRVDCGLMFITGEVDELPGLIFAILLIAHSGAACRYPDVVVMVTRESVVKAAASMQNMGVPRLSDSRGSNAQNGGRSGDNQLIWSASLGVT